MRSLITVSTSDTAIQTLSFSIVQTGIEEANKWSGILRAEEYVIQVKGQGRYQHQEHFRDTQAGGWLALKHLLLHSTATFSLSNGQLLIMLLFGSHTGTN